jgi:hypothetical protein
MYNGEMYSLGIVATVTAGSVNYLQAKTGANLFHTITREHIFDGGGPFLIEVIENPTLTDGTIPIVATNMNRTSAKTHTMSFFANPTGISGGSIIDTMYLPATGAGLNKTGLGGEENERILKKNTNYLLRITNNGSQGSTLFTRLIFFETVN